MEPNDCIKITEHTHPSTAEPVEGVSSAPTLSPEEQMKAKYEDIYGKIYRVGVTLEPDDETELEMSYYFRKPATASYDRYVKTMSQSASKSSKAFLMDNILAEDKARLEADLKEYPALALSLAEKLMSVLGLSKTTNLKLL